MKSMRSIMATIIVLAIALAAVPQAHAFSILDSAFCYGYSATTLEPTGIGSTYFTYSEKAVFWAKIQDPPASSVEIRVVWVDPSDTQFRSQAVTVTPKTGQNWGIVTDSINIAESTAKNKLGVWTVSLYIDHVEELAAEFQIIDYESIVQSIANANAMITQIRAEKTLLETQYQQQAQILIDLQADYTALQAQVGTSTDYQELQTQYNTLNTDYLNLSRELSTTRMMMYAAVVVAVASVGVAVYFGAIKKS
ncbi:MAG TPA: hypothetical protein VGB32_03510 [Candidatus Bathyarchaeia archaeon]